MDGTTESTDRYDAVVVGGGLGGLSAAALLGRRGAKVLLLERGSELGGRARTRHERGFCFNWGPHALYRGGAADRVLRQLGIDPPGRPAGGSGGYLREDDTLHTLPAGPVSLLSTGGFGLADKVALARLMTSVPRWDAPAHASTSVAAWIAGLGVRPPVQRFLKTMVRLTSYAHAPDHLSAATAIGQLQLALTNGVRYLDGGWATLVSMLEHAARANRVDIRRGAHVERIEEDPAPRVVLADGHAVGAGSVVLAVPPSEVASLLPSEADRPLREQIASFVPVRAACLTVALRRVPKPATRIVLDLDRPLYLSNHSAYADLGSDGAVFHLARYLAPDDTRDTDHAEELEALLDHTQPGWRDELEARWLLPRITVTPALPLAREAGARPPVILRPQLGLVGDWVGPEGFLADATFASAEVAARSLPTFHRQPNAA